MRTDRIDHIKALQRQIDELKNRFPAHSIPPAMMAELDELEEQLSVLLKGHQKPTETDR